MFITFLALVSGLLSLSAAEPEAGTLDTSFGEGGILHSSLPAGSWGSPIFTQAPGGKTLIARCYSEMEVNRIWYGRCLIQRLLSDGSVDTSFGENGTTIVRQALNLYLSDYQPKKIIVLQDGKILIVGDRQTEVLVIRLTAAGQLDTAFSEDGVAQFVSPVYASLHVNKTLTVVDALQQANGRIFVLCTCKNTFVDYEINPLLLSCSETGQLDVVFDKIPVNLRVPQHTGGQASALASSAFNDLYIGGWSVDGTQYYQRTDVPYLFRIPNGGGVSAMQRLTLAGSSHLPGQVGDLVIDDQGMLLVNVIRDSPNNDFMEISRYDREGGRDGLFMEGGVQTLLTEYHAPTARPYPMAVQSDGRIVLMLRKPGALLTRLMPSGVLDAGFGDGGHMLLNTAIAPTNEVRSLEVLSDDKILVDAYGETASDMILSRLHPGPPASLPVPEIVTQTASLVSAPSGQPCTLSVTIAGDEAVVFEWLKDGVTLQRSQVITSVTSSYTIPSVSLSADGFYTVMIRNKHGRTFSEPMKVHAIAPPVILSQTGAEFVVPNQGSSMKITVAGRPPIQYRLLRDGEEILTGVATNQSSQGVADIVVKDPGNYEVILTNEDGEARSEVFPVLLQTDPYIWIAGARLYRVGEAGEALSYRALSAFGGEMEWRKNGKVVSGDYVTGRLFLPSPMTLADAATYTATLRIPKKSHTTPPLEIGVVDTAPQNAYMAAGKKVSFTATVAGKSLTYAWKKDGEPLTASSRIPKVNDKTLTITKAELSDAGNYVCTVTHPSGETLDAPFSLIADLTAPTPPASLDRLPDSTLGQHYHFDFDTENRSATHAITGLPKGLVYNKVTGVISGQPRISGDYRVKITSTNLIGSSRFELPLKVLPLAHPVAGVYEGLETTGSDTAVSLKLTVTATAAFSASIRLQNAGGKVATRKMTGRLTWDAEEQLYRFNAEDPPAGSGKAYLHLGFALNPFVTGTDVYPLSGYVSSHVGGTSFKGIHKGSWKAGSPSSTAFSGYYTVILDSFGSGTASFTVSPTGALTFLGREPDGTVLSCAADLDELGRFPVSIWRQGSLSRYKGWGIITPDAASDYRNSGVRSHNVARNFSEKEGFIGTKYLPPNVPGISSPLMMNIPEETESNVTLSLSGEALSSVPSTGRLTLKHKLFIPPLGRPGAGDSIQITSLVFNPAKGTFKADVAMHFFDPWTEKHAGTRRFSFQGLATRNPDSLLPAAYGFATWKGRIWDDEDGRYHTVLQSEMIHIIPTPAPAP